MAPLMTQAMQRGREKPAVLATATATGTMRVIVPTLVPIARETKALTMKSTRTAY